jgi:ATPase subunit of ABC transporter with duplicated ATPase domains
MPQEPDAEPGETVSEYLARRTGIAQAEAEMDGLATDMRTDISLIDAYTESVERFVGLGGDDLEARVSQVCRRLGLDESLRDSRLRDLSGGEAARASLAAILLARFDILLLDEPTNNLDFEGLALLEDFMIDARVAIAVISHDRAFLERTVDRVVELEDGTHSAVEYAGGWREYVVEKERRRRRLYAGHESFVRETARLREQVVRQRTWAETRARRAKNSDDPDKHVRFARLQAAQKAASTRKIEARLRRLENVDKPWEGWELHLAFPTVARGGDVVARLDEAVVELRAFRLGPVTLEVRWGERVAIVGPNGSGKTTLLSVLRGGTPLLSGHRYVGRSVVLGEMGQRRDAFLGPRTVLDVFAHEATVSPEQSRSLLAKFGLGAADVDRPSASLSPGERTRATLALIVAQGVNCLILDEPTNHLDLVAIEQLEGALGAFEGTLLLVTHDRRLLENFRATTTVALERGRVKQTS